MIYKNRFDAGSKLSLSLKKYKNDSKVVIVGIPRGGVEVAFYVSKKLELPMEITMAKKIGDFFNPELAIGAVAEENTVVLNNNLIESLNISNDYIESKIQEKKQEIKEKLKHYREKDLSVENKKVIIVDDGIATGATIKAIIQFFENKKALKIVVAVPVASREAVQEIENLCDEIVCPLIPRFFNAVGAFYQEFSQVTDKQVIDFMKKIKNND